MQSPELDNKIVDPEFWSHEGEIHELLTWLRHNDPLRYIEPEGFAPFWNVTKYDDIKAIEGNKKVSTLAVANLGPHSTLLTTDLPTTFS